MDATQQLCRLWESRIQNTVGLLLLTNDVRILDSPGSRTRGGRLNVLRDTIRHDLRLLQLRLKELLTMLRREEFPEGQLPEILHDICDHVVGLVEGASSAGCLFAVLEEGSEPEVTGMFNMVKLRKALIDINYVVNLLNALPTKDLTAEKISRLIIHVETNVFLLTDQFQIAMDEANHLSQKLHFRNAIRVLSASGAACLSSLQSLEEEVTVLNKHVCCTFGLLLANVSCLLVQLSMENPLWSGASCRFSQKGKDARQNVTCACLNVVSPVTMVYSCLAESGRVSLSRIEKCVDAATRSIRPLLDALGISTIELSYY